MTKFLTPQARISFFFAGTAVAWLVVALAGHAEIQSMAPIGAAAALNGATFLLGIWTPPPPWPRQRSLRIFVALGALISAFSSFLPVVVWVWAGVPAHRG